MRTHLPRYLLIALLAGGLQFFGLSAARADSVTIKGVKIGVSPCSPAIRLGGTSNGVAGRLRTFLETFFIAAGVLVEHDNY